MAQAHLPSLTRLLCCLLLAALACAIPGAQQPTALVPTGAATSPAPLGRATPLAGATSTVAAFRGEAVSGAADRLSPANSFAPFSAVPGSTLDPGLSRRDLDDLQKLDGLQQLSAAQQDALLAYGFVVVPTPFDTFAAAYERGAEQKLPAFITADAILHAFRVVTDVACQRSEALYLPADLQALSHAMVSVSERQWEQAQDDATAQAARRNLAFFAVASSLLDPGFQPPTLVAQVVADELTLIAQGGRFISPLFGVEEDYSRFSQRRQDAPGDVLVRYFRALSWLGRPYSLAYAPAGSATLEPLAAARLSARQALLMAWGLHESENLSRWQRVFEPTIYFQGSTVAWSLPQVRVVSEILYGAQPAVADLQGDALLDDFLATMHLMPPSLPFAPDPRPAFSLLPPFPADHDAAPDAAILQGLVFNRIGAYTGDAPLPRTAVQTEIGPIRGLPRSLDVAAALGSPLAHEAVDAAGDAAYEGYALQLQQVQERYAALEPAAWTTSFDGGWLFALQPLLAELSPDGFLYAPPEAWQARQLSTWHAAWSALRHETELLPRPVAAVAVSPDVAHGYLEPQPLLYGRLASLAGQVLDGLGSRGLLDEESAGKLRQLQRLLEAARAISRKELVGQRLSADEALLLSQLPARLSNLTTYDPAPGQTVPQTGAALPRLVDVHQEPSTGKLLQVATGEAWPIYVLVPREDGVMLTMGAILSSYELHGEQLTADAWRDMQNRPPPPDWLHSFVVSD